MTLDVGVHGKLGEQAHVESAQGAWKELTENINQMASNLTLQVRDISTVCKAVAKGDLSTKVNLIPDNTHFTFLNTAFIRLLHKLMVSSWI